MVLKVDGASDGRAGATETGPSAGAEGRPAPISAPLVEAVSTALRMMMTSTQTALSNGCKGSWSAARPGRSSWRFGLVTWHKRRRHGVDAGEHVRVVSCSTVQSVSFRVANQSPRAVRVPPGPRRFAPLRLAAVEALKKRPKRPMSTRGAADRQLAGRPTE